MSGRSGLSVVALDRVCEAVGSGARVLRVRPPRRTLLECHQFFGRPDLTLEVARERISNFARAALAL